MITNKEIEALELSPVKKDFYQIWNELLDTASKISARWDPASTNESDPGIVLLKVLTGIADKLNYNIDKNILEAFMPSATQMESMRKLCELVGYNMAYYQSATTEAKLGWGGYIINGKFAVEKDSNDSDNQSTLAIPQFSIIKDIDGKISYITTESATLSATIPVITIPCIEGQLCRCGADNDYTVFTTNLDEQNRYFLPEAKIAENGIFIYTKTGTEPVFQDRWTKVENLNTQAAKQNVYKIGFNSSRGVPYIQFPADINELAQNGLYIYYIRTSGVNGNIAARTLSTLELETPTGNDDKDLSGFYELVTVTNENAVMNGADIETIDQAYESYKKTIGTFDTLVTCRDYMNKIYTIYDDLNIPAVSNCIVSDIRDDINRAYTLCTFGESGLKYQDKALLKTESIIGTHKIKDATTGEITAEEELEVEVKTPQINNFDLILYPFTTVYGLNNEEEFINSFKYSAKNLELIKQELQKLKTISHKFIEPNSDDILCIKNYFRLSAKITTTRKVNAIEEAYILKNVQKNLYATFNCRQLDFGEDIPFDIIEKTIQEADTLIKNVSMDDPELITKIALCGGGDEITISDSNNTDEHYIKLLLRNILAGRISLFDYNENFKPEVTEAPYGYAEYENLYENVMSIAPSLNFDTNKIKGSNYEVDYEKLQTNEIIQFRAKNFKTTLTYPAYVNYYANLPNIANADTRQEAKAASFISILDFMNSNSTITANKTRWEELVDCQNANPEVELSQIAHLLFASKTEIAGVTGDTWNSLCKAYGALFYIENDIYVKPTTFAGEKTYYAIPIVNESNNSAFNRWKNYLSAYSYGRVKNLYVIYSSDWNTPGYLVDEDGCKYQARTVRSSFTNDSSLSSYFIPDYSNANAANNNYGLGIDGALGHVPANSEYMLGTNEYILINYTKSSDSSSTDTANSTKDIIINEVLGPGTYIRANFDLYHSNELAGQKTYSKRTNIGPWAGISSTPEGMFTLGPNEQIEVREPVILELESNTNFSKNINVYWILNNEDATFPATEVAGNDFSSYILQDGEYFFYTDEHKMEMSYFGNGTEIRLYNIPSLKKNTNETIELSVEDVLEKGILSIPWVLATIDPISATSQRKIEIVEYQYITLSAGDQLEDIDGLADSPTLSAKFQKCKSAQYILNGEQNTLPQFIGGGDDLFWEVASKLILDVGPTKAQTLTQIYTGNARANVAITIDDEDDPVVLENKQAYGELSFKTNYPCQTTNSSLALKEPISISVFSNKLITYDESSTGETAGQVSLANLNNYWTKLAFSNFQTESTKDIEVNLYTKIPNDNFGMIMVYVITEDDELTPDNMYNVPYITIEGDVIDEEDASAAEEEGGDVSGDDVSGDDVSGDDASSEEVDDDTPNICIYNYNDNSVIPSWWWAGRRKKEEEESHYRYYLRAGINCIQINQKCAGLTLHKNTGNLSKNNVIIFSELDLINAKNNATGINYAILGLDKDYCTELLRVLRTDYDPDFEFYYNCPMDNSTAIDLNASRITYTEGGTQKVESYLETMTTPSTWFDYNNMNNKFTISVLDTEFLKKGISLTRTSRI